MALFLPPIVAVVTLALLTVAALRWRRALLAAAASWVLFGGVAVVAPWLPLSTGHPADGVTVAAANVLTGNAHPTLAATDLMATGADVLVVPEVSTGVHHFLAKVYPFAHRQAPNGGSMGVYTRLPATVLPEVPGTINHERYLRVRIGGDEPFVLWALHLPRPWFTSEGIHQRRPRGHAITVDRVLAAVDAEALPVVVAGDLNLTDRGRGYRKFTDRFDDAMRSIAGRRTSLKMLFRPLLLRIDHVLMPEDWCADQARRFEITGSDHRGVMARLGPCSPR